MSITINLAGVPFLKQGEAEYQTIVDYSDGKEIIMILQGDDEDTLRHASDTFLRFWWEFPKHNTAIKKAIADDALKDLPEWSDETVTEEEFIQRIWPSGIVFFDGDVIIAYYELDGMFTNHCMHVNCTLKETLEITDMYLEG